MEFDFLFFILVYSTSLLFTGLCAQKYLSDKEDKQFVTCFAFIPIFNILTSFLFFCFLIILIIKETFEKFGNTKAILLFSFSPIILLLSYHSFLFSSQYLYQPLWKVIYGNLF